MAVAKTRTPATYHLPVRGLCNVHLLCYTYLCANLRRSATSLMKLVRSTCGHGKVAAASMGDTHSAALTLVTSLPAYPSQT